MRSAVWVLDPLLPAGRAEAILAELTAAGAQASLRDLRGARAIVVDDPPALLQPPEGVVRAARVDLPGDGALTRRAFLDAFAGALAVAVAGAGVAVAASFAGAPPPRRDEVAEVEAASVAELRARGSVRFLFGREPGIVVLADDRIRAFSLVCPHLGCLVDWVAARRRFECPCHDGLFGIEGNVLGGPPEGPLPQFDVRTEGDRVVVRRRTSA